MADVTHLKNRGRREEGRENWDAAIDLYRRALLESLEKSDSAADLSLFNRIGDIQRRKGDLEAAVATYEQAVTAYAARDLHTSAIALCNKVLRVMPERAEAYLSLGRLRLAIGLVAQARADYLRYAAAMRERGEVGEAADALEELLVRALDAEVARAFVEAVRASEDDRQASERIERSVRALEDSGADPAPLRRAAGLADPVDETPVDEEPVDGAPSPGSDRPPSVRGIAALEAELEAAVDGETEPAGAELAAAERGSTGAALEGADEEDRPDPIAPPPPARELPEPGVGDVAGRLRSPGVPLPAASPVESDPGAAFDSPPAGPRPRRDPIDPCPGPSGGRGRPSPDGAGALETEEVEAGITRGPRLGPARARARREGREPDVRRAADLHRPPSSEGAKHRARPASWRGRAGRADREAAEAAPAPSRPRGALRPGWMERPEATRRRSHGKRSADPAVRMAWCVRTPDPAERLRVARRPAAPARPVTDRPEAGPPATISMGPLGWADPDPAEPRRPARRPIPPRGPRREGIRVPPGNPPAFDPAPVRPRAEGRDPVHPRAEGRGPGGPRAEGRDIVARAAARPRPERPSGEGTEENLELPGGVDLSTSAGKRSGNTVSGPPAPPARSAPPDGEGGAAESEFAAWLGAANPEVLERSLDELARRGEVERVLDVIEALLEHRPGDLDLHRKRVAWAQELSDDDRLHRAYAAFGVVLTEAGLQEEAREVCRELIRRIGPDDARVQIVLDHLEGDESSQAPSADSRADEAVGFAGEVGDPPDGSAETAEEAPAEVGTAEDPTEAGGNGGRRPISKEVEERRQGAEGEDEGPPSLPDRRPAPAAEGRPADGSGPYDHVGGRRRVGTVDFDVILSELKEQLAERGVDTDTRSRTELGERLKEMGLLDDAIRELQAAVRVPGAPPRAYELLGAAFIEKGQARVAARLLSSVVDESSRADRELLGILYQLGVAYQDVGDPPRALECFERIFSIDIDYRDVQERIASCA